MADPVAVAPEQAAESLERLKTGYCEVEAVKARNRAQLSKSAAEVLDKLAASDPAELARLLARFAIPAPTPLPLLARRKGAAPR